MSLKYFHTFLMLLLVDWLCDAQVPRSQTPRSFIFTISTRKTNTKSIKMKESTIQRGDKKQTHPPPKGTKAPTLDQEWLHRLGSVPTMSHQWSKNPISILGSHAWPICNSKNRVFGNCYELPLTDPILLVPIKLSHDPALPPLPSLQLQLQTAQFSSA